MKEMRSKSLSPDKIFQSCEIVVRSFQAHFVILCASRDDQIAGRDRDTLLTGLAGEVICCVPYAISYRKFREYLGEIPQNLFLLIAAGAIPQFQLNKRAPASLA